MIYTGVGEYDGSKTSFGRRHTKTVSQEGVPLCPNEKPSSTMDATSKCLLNTLSVFAECMTKLPKEG